MEDYWCPDGCLCYYFLENNCFWVKVVISRGIAASGSYVSNVSTSQEIATCDPEFIDTNNPLIAFSTY